jgi:Leucine-rich repeat (LRR) protein
LVELDELDLRDNRISKIQGLETLTKVVDLDLSYNAIRKIENLQGQTLVKKLYLSANKISQITNLSSMPDLTMLELGANRIRLIENMEPFTQLTELYVMLWCFSSLASRLGIEKEKQHCCCRRARVHASPPHLLDTLQANNRLKTTSPTSSFPSFHQ